MFSKLCSGKELRSFSVLVPSDIICKFSLKTHINVIYIMITTTLVFTYSEKNRIQQKLYLKSSTYIK